MVCTQVPLTLTPTNFSDDGSLSGSKCATAGQATANAQIAIHLAVVQCVGHHPPGKACRRRSSPLATRCRQQTIRDLGQQQGACMAVTLTADVV